MGLTVTDWLPDETLFSLVSRQHCVSGNVHACQTCREAFGVDRIGPQANIPVVPTAFVDATHGRWGSAQEVLLQRTVLPFYFPVTSAQLRAQVLASLTSGEPELARYCLGRLTGRFGAHLPLKACPACMTEDLARFGVAYWDRLHQLPSVWVCPTHRSLLLAGGRRMKGGMWAELSLPELSMLHRPPVAVEEAEDVLPLGWRVAKNSASYMARAPQLCLDRTRVAAVLAARAVERGACSDTGNLDFRQCAQFLLWVCEASCGLPEFAALHHNERRAASMARRMFGPEFRQSVQALLIAVSGLYDNWDDFEDAYVVGPSDEVLRARRSEVLRAARVLFW